MRCDLYEYVLEILSYIFNCSQNTCMSCNFQHVFICSIKVWHVLICRLKLNDICLQRNFLMWCHPWWTDSGELRWWVSGVSSTFHPLMLARSWISHPTLSSRAHWGTYPGLAFPVFRQYSTCLLISWLVSAPRNLPCVPLAVLHASILMNKLVISSSAALPLFSCCAKNLWSASTLGKRQLALVCCA